MEMKHKKTTGLFMLFLRYLIGLSVTALLLAGILMVIYFTGIQTGVILPANFAERLLREKEEELKLSDPFDAALVPFTCKYAFFDTRDRFVEGTMNSGELENAVLYLYSDSITPPGFYFTVYREDGICIIRYDMITHFASERLHRLCPNPGLLMVLLYVSSFLLLLALTTLRIRRKLNSQLSPLIEATDAVGRQDLEFVVMPTGIREFNSVLGSIEDMREALKSSMERQWEEEQNRRTQIAALAHDIRTPLTLVRGNAELLLEEELSEESRELADTILRSAGRMEQYMTLLMDAVTTAGAGSTDTEMFLSDEFVKELIVQGEELCHGKSLLFIPECGLLPGKIKGDRTLLMRAMVNILDNAVEHSPRAGRVGLYIRIEDESLLFTVTDEGNGFTSEELKQAKTPFYTSQKERSGRHYGMGLYLAQTAAVKHGGTLLTMNREDCMGAAVTLGVSLPPYI